ncbi:hypothetical protein Bra3105_11735 [Brachybacterium halotolerans subsp. kimchii]|uniref:hypothetical protein n=1 Tax=Brachybacterium halotolerans TaxID=2795215 RepID=UPI001E60408C|nr:hypothetical protein [Brachybacterium halotolerans]UEJ81512.1 hypothetical protein Bra3105_11735 [Brachybacterium halotolerans subsp. kimchii]
MADRPAAHVLTADPRERASWRGLADVSERMPAGWSLAGGSLVRLHVAERGGDAGRATRDIDVILDVRSDPRSIARIVDAMQTVGFLPDGLNPAGHDHRWVRGDAQIDVLAPAFLGSHLLDRSHRGLGRLLPTRGAQFGLNRTERVHVRVDDFDLMVNRPDLVGALYEKCSALLVSLDRGKGRHLEDISLLSELLTPQDRRELIGLRRRERLRVIRGLRRTQEGIDLDPRRRRRVGQLEQLLLSTLERPMI